MKLTYPCFISRLFKVEMLLHDMVVSQCMACRKAHCQCTRDTQNIKLISVCTLFTIYYFQIKLRLAQTLHNGGQNWDVKLTLEC